MDPGITSWLKQVLVSLDDNDRPVYHLSRIAQNGYGIKIIVAKDRNLAALGHPRLGGRSCKFVQVPVAISMVGYPGVHARCWDMIERLFGCEVEKNLRTLLDIFQERWAGLNGTTHGSTSYSFLREDLLWRKKSLVLHDPVKILPLRTVVEKRVLSADAEKVL